MEASDQRAREAGTLPETSAPEISGVGLPAGRVISPDPDFVSQQPPAQPEPVLWISSKPVHDVGTVWRRLASTFPTHGLWPLVLESLDGEDSRPWLVGELDPTASTSPDAHDPETVLAGWWSEVTPIEEEGEN